MAVVLNPTLNVSTLPAEFVRENFVQPSILAALKDVVRQQPLASLYIKATVSSILGSDFNFKQPTPDDLTLTTGLAIYDELTKILPVHSEQSLFFWRKVGKPFASMLDAAAFPITSQIAFLTFFHERVIGMLGPLQSLGSKSYMTFDGSPVELSWVIPSNVKPGAGVTGRQVRFAIEPIDPETGELLAGVEVLKYFTSREGGLGLVKSDKGVLDWSVIADEFLYSKEDQRRFFVGFDFSRTGEITLKTYYIPLARPSDTSSKPHLWDVDYLPLRSLITTLDASLMDSLDMIISFSEEVDPQFKPRLQILSMDCVPNEVNRLKMYCRPSYGTSWSDARRAFTLGGKLDCPKMDQALEHLETLWNLLFPFAASHSNRQLEAGLELATHGNTCERRSPDHPTGGLLFYYSLVPGSGMILPKIYLPVSRYCPNDEFISEALEKFYALNGGELQERGWVSREVSSAYNHRPLREKCGIFTYVTFALKKNYKWEVTNYFSPEVWE